MLFKKSFIEWLMKNGDNVSYDQASKSYRTVLFYLGIFVVFIVATLFFQLNKPDACDCNDEWAKKQMGAGYDHKHLDECYDAYDDNFNWDCMKGRNTTR